VTMAAPHSRTWGMERRRSAAAAVGVLIPRL
jgi:hypothetical protein